MELIKKNIHMEHSQNLASMQISLEEDQNISDQKPDAFQVICKKADVKIGECKVQDESVWVRGVLAYRVLYLTDETEKRLCNMEGEIPFEEKIYINQACMNDEVRVVAHTDDMMIRLINSRKMNIRCIVAVSVMCDTLYDEEVVVDVENPTACEILKKSLNITTIVRDTRDIYRIKEEFPVPDGYPNIYSLLWKNIRIDGLDFVPMDGRIGIQGEWTAFCMYEGEEEETEPRYFEVSRAFDGTVEMPECRDDMVLSVDWEAEQAQIEVRSDYDGEERLIGLDMELKLFIKLHKNEELTVVADAYGLQEMLEPVMKESAYKHMVKKESGKIKAGDTWENRENPEQMMQILHVHGYIVDEKNTIGDNQVILAGVVHVDALCKIEDESEPYRSISLDLPYMQNIAVSQISKDSPFYVKVCIEQLHAAMQGNKMDVRATLGYCLNVYRKASEPMLVGLEKTVENGREKALPVMSVYYAKDSELLWDVCKKYRVSLNSVKEINQINTDVLCSGDKILIAKEMQ